MSYLAKSLFHNRRTNYNPNSFQTNIHGSAKAATRLGDNIKALKISSSKLYRDVDKHQHSSRAKKATLERKMDVRLKLVLQNMEKRSEALTKGCTKQTNGNYHTNQTSRELNAARGDFLELQTVLLDLKHKIDTKEISVLSKKIEQFLQSSTYIQANAIANAPLESEQTTRLKDPQAKPSQKPTSTQPSAKPKDKAPPAAPAQPASSSTSRVPKLHPPSATLTNAHAIEKQTRNNAKANAAARAYVVATNLEQEISMQLDFLESAINSEQGLNPRQLRQLYFQATTFEGQAQQATGAAEVFNLELQAPGLMRNKEQFIANLKTLAATASNLQQSQQEQGMNNQEITKSLSSIQTSLKLLLDNLSIAETPKPERPRLRFQQQPQTEETLSLDERDSSSLSRSSSPLVRAPISNRGSETDSHSENEEIETKM